MSLKAMTWVWENSKAEGSARLVHLAMADVSNDAYDNELWLGTWAIAKKCLLSDKTVRRCLDELEAMGYIELLEQGGGRGKRSRYKLNLDNSTGFSETLSDGETRTDEALNLDNGDDPATYITQVTQSCAERARDEVFDAVCAVCNIDPEKLTKTGRGPLNKAVGDLKSVGANEADVFYAAGAYGRKFPQAALTPMALAKNWAQLQPDVLREIRPGAMGEPRVEQNPLVGAVLSDEELAANQERIRALREGLRDRRFDY